LIDHTHTYKYTVLTAVFHENNS